MKITKEQVSRDIYTNNKIKNYETRVSFEQIYWTLFAGFGLLIGCFFLILNFMY